MYRLSKISCIAIVCMLCIGLITCKKSGTVEGNTIENFFEKNVLNKNFVVVYATDSSVDITTQYNGYTFVLLKTDFYHGPLQVSKNGTILTGSWSSNDDYSKLVITLPSTPPEFVFLSRQWRFTSKSIPVLKLAPWTTRAPVVLHMLRQ